LKIPLLIRERFKELMPFTFIVLSNPEYRVSPRPIWVLVDTGSPWTALTPYDAILSKVPTHALKRATDFSEFSFAGHKFWRLMLPEIILSLKYETGKMSRYEMPSITIMNPTKKIPPEEFKGIPSVLGVDFLRINGFYLHFDPKNNEAFLEKI